MKIFISMLIIIAVTGLAWSIFSFIGVRDKTVAENTTENFTEFISNELTDICSTPEGYTPEEWREHMSHHPDRYAECLEN